MKEPRARARGPLFRVSDMNRKTIRLRLNQQQLELIDKSIAAGEAGSRAELVRRALREFAAEHVPAASGHAKER